MCCPSGTHALTTSSSRSLHPLSNEADIKFFKGKVTESAKRLGRIQGYLDQKEWEEVRAELSRQVRQSRERHISFPSSHSPTPRAALMTFTQHRSCLLEGSTHTGPSRHFVLVPFMQMYDFRRSALKLAEAKGTPAATNAAKKVRRLSTSHASRTLL